MTSQKIVVPQAHPQGHDMEQGIGIRVRRRQNSVSVDRIGVTYPVD
jgi:hypothetical protein